VAAAKLEQFKPRPPLPEARGRRVHGSVDDARKSKDRATQEPELFKTPMTTPSPSRTPCFLFTVLFAASPERQGAGLLHKEDVAVEAMDRAALLPLLQAIPRCSFHHLATVSRAQGEPQTLHLVVDPAFEPRLDRAM
jgi:hypothetical protein